MFNWDLLWRARGRAGIVIACTAFKARSCYSDVPRWPGPLRAILDCAEGTLRNVRLWLLASVNRGVGEDETSWGLRSGVGAWDFFWDKWSLWFLVKWRVLKIVTQTSMFNRTRFKMAFNVCIGRQHSWVVRGKHTSVLISKWVCYFLTLFRMDKQKHNFRHCYYTYVSPIPNPFLALSVKYERNIISVKTCSL
jgi:hypothetical protein